MLLLKHIRNWSYEVVERDVRANLVYRSFTRVGGGKVTVVEEPIYAGANGALQLALDMPAEYWQQLHD